MTFYRLKKYFYLFVAIQLKKGYPMVTGSDPGTEPSKTRLTRCLTHITSRRYNDDLQYSIALKAPAPCYEGNVAVDP